MTMFTRVLLYFLQTLVLKSAAARLKKKGILVYLKTLQVVRRSLLAAVAVCVLLQLLVFGIIGTVITAVLLTPLESQTKLWVLFGFFSVLTVIAGVVFLAALSEKVWFYASGAQDLIARSSHPDREPNI